MEKFINYKYGPIPTVNSMSVRSSKILTTETATDSQIITDTTASQLAQDQDISLEFDITTNLQVGTVVTNSLSSQNDHIDVLRDLRMKDKNISVDSITTNQISSESNFIIIPNDIRMRQKELDVGTVILTNMTSSFDYIDVFKDLRLNGNIRSGIKKPFKFQMSKDETDLVTFAEFSYERFRIDFYKKTFFADDIDVSNGKFKVPLKL